MNLTTLLADVYRRTKHAASPPTDVTTRLTAYINDWHRRILSMPGMGGLRDDTITFASVASTARYALPVSVAKIKGISERTNDQTLRPKSLDWYRTVDPDPQEGTPEYWIPFSWTQVAVQPSNASEVFVKSTSASDTAIVAYLRGIRTGGYPVTLSVTLTGVTAVTLGSAYTDIIEITEAYISAAAVGTVTFHEDSGAGTELARIAIGQTNQRYQTILLWPTPAAVVTYYVDYTREMQDLVNGTDEPLIPIDFHWLLIDGARYSEYEYLDDTRRFEIWDARRGPGRETGTLADGIKNLRCWKSSGEVIVSGQMVQGRSRFGPHYPADWY